MSKIAAFGILFVAMASVGWVNSLEKSGAIANDCNGYFGPYKCTHQTPTISCDSIQSYISGSDPQNSLKNRKSNSVELKCAEKSNSNKCIGTAIEGEACTP
jgi:hypothetical protein